MKHFFVSSKTISFLPFKKILDVDASLDSKTINFTWYKDRPTFQISSPSNLGPPVIQGPNFPYFGL